MEIISLWKDVLNLTAGIRIECKTYFLPRIFDLVEDAGFQLVTNGLIFL